MKRVLALLLFACTAAASPISVKYAQLGGENGFLGKKTSEETVAPDGVGSFQHFQGGSIFFHPECGAREVHGLTTLDKVPAYKNERVVVSYEGPWNRAFDRVGVEGAAFDLAPFGVATQTLSLKTTLIH